jgi:hypothetical protein
MFAAIPLHKGHTPIPVFEKILYHHFFYFYFFSAAKSQSYKSSLLFQKYTYAAASIQVPYEEEVLTGAIKAYMSERGFKEARYKDIVVFRSVPLDNNSAVYSDAYFSIVRKSRSEKDMTIVNLLPVKREATLSPSTAEDSSLTRLAVIYLDSMRHNILNYSLKQRIQAQEKTVDKIKGKMLSLKNDSGDIAKKTRNYESDLQENKADQEKLNRDISSISSGDQASLSKTRHKMDKLLDNQTDYEKKIRNYKAELNDNAKHREMMQTSLDSETQALTSLKQRLQNLCMGKS